ncbi:endonuclease/exonuclease/phosphatase family protein [Pedobacter jejuensis]|uniref:endonuclease/exonuclease/phosphatase family protein n=1 Tax=Pedobacter jejuensis TaxID=1268550 RepID=UPI001FC9F0DE|nr:endonuclease/exonuclease/phosphatase family protein [Pedobacter jejuensis]
MNLILIISLVIFLDSNKPIDIVVLAALSVNLIYLFYLIFPFTIFGKKQIVSSKLANNTNNLKLLIANVYQENRQSATYYGLIEKCKPDVILMVETNKWWQTQMDVLEKEYPYQIKVPLENTYGMLLYSKLELNGEVKFLVEEDIPSIETDVKLSSGQTVKLFCLHPQPPVPQENPRSTERDKEILLVAEKAKKCDLPVVVMGDLNDVAWSYTTELFGKISGLLDPRRGRGFFNSFNAKYFFLRFPLDHIFCSPDFSLSSIKRLKSCGSDHFPMWVNLQFNPEAEELNHVPEATQEDKALAEEKINTPT